MSLSSTLTIEELAGKRRTLVLRGAGLPFWGAKWTEANALVTTWYPGNGDEATQQVLGPRLMPSTWNGEWSRVLLSREPAILREGGSEILIVAPKTLRDAFSSITGSGVRLRVVFSLDGGNRPEMRDKIVREGRASQFEATYVEGYNLQWSVNFDWQSRGGARKTAVSSREDSLIASTAAMVVQTEAALARMNTAIRTAGIRTTGGKGIPTSLTLGQLERMADAPRKYVRDLLRRMQQQVNNARRVLGIAQKVRAVPFEIANAAVDFAANTVAICNQSADELGREPPEKLAATQKASDVARAARDFGRTVDELAGVARRSADIAARFRTQRVRTAGADEPSNAQLSAGSLTGRIKTVHTVHEGDTPLSLSMKYYETPDRAEDILRSNRLPIYQTTFTIGAHLIIPEVGSGPQMGA